MEEMIYKTGSIPGHPNRELEDDLKTLEAFVEVGENGDDLRSINYLKDKLYTARFSDSDIALINQFKDRYMKKPNPADHGGTV